MANIAFKILPLEIDKWTNAHKATDGNVTDYDAHNGFTYAKHPADFTIDLGEEKLIYAIRVLLW